MDKNKENKNSEHYKILDDLLHDTADDWKLRMLAITHLIQYLDEERNEITKELEECETNQLHDIAVKYATVDEVDKYIDYAFKNDKESNETYGAVVYVNIVYYGLPAVSDLPPTDETHAKMKVVGFTTLLYKAMQCIKISMDFDFEATII